jgi:cell division protein FtsA
VGVANNQRVRLAVGLDAGSAHTRCVVCAVEDSKIRFLGAGQVDSRGWAKSRISDQNLMSESIRLAAREAEKHAQISFDAAVVGLGGTAIQGANARGVYEFGRPREIDQTDMSYAVELACRVRLEDDRILLQVFPQDFTVDGRAGIVNPRGMKASRLEANVHVVTTSAQDHQALVSAVHQAHLAVEETVFESMAAAYAAILPEDRARGVALVDIGSQSTDLVVYDGEAMVLAASLPISADHFTRDVAWVFRVSYEDAVKLKEEYGCAILGLTADSTLIEVPSTEDRPSREATRRQLNEILEARAEELFLYVKKELHKIGMEQSLLEGMVLAGGGARLNGMCDMAERVLNCQTRNGLAVGIQDWPDELDNTSWTTAAGLAMYSGRLKTHRDQKRRSPSFFNLVMR